MCFPTADTAGSTPGLPAHTAQDAKQPVAEAGPAGSPALLWARSQLSTLEQHSPGGNVEPIRFPALLLVEDYIDAMCSLLGREFPSMLQTTEPLKMPSAPESRGLTFTLLISHPLEHTGPAKASRELAASRSTGLILHIMGIAWAPKPL